MAQARSDRPSTKDAATLLQRPPIGVPDVDTMASPTELHFTFIAAAKTNHNSSNDKHTWDRTVENVLPPRYDESPFRLRIVIVFFPVSSWTRLSNSSAASMASCACTTSKSCPASATRLQKAGSVAKRPLHARADARSRAESYPWPAAHPAPHLLGTTCPGLRRTV